MKIKINITNIKPVQLNSACLRLISQFAYQLRKHNGTVLELQDHNIICNVVYHAKASKNEKLQTIYMELLDELKQHMNSPEFEAHLPSLIEQSQDTNEAHCDQHSMK